MVALTVGWLCLRASLPSLDGTRSMPGLSASVRIERDAAGVPTITAGDRKDLARGLGFVHGQDRYFQMDLLRRAAAGELSALLGPALLPVDRKLRLHQFRSVAHAVVGGLDPPSRALLDAYVEGVNAGLKSLRSRPFEYWMLQSQPKPWSAEDTVLCVHAMFLQLQDADGHTQVQRGLLQATLPPALSSFLEGQAPEWDAAIDGSIAPEPRIPAAEAADLRAMQGLQSEPPAEVIRQLNALGSNNWAVAGSRTATGAAMVANDMHLDYRVPNIWYRVRLIDTLKAEAFEATGVSLPGTPSIVAGSNGSIAWGFTNSYGEFASVVRLVAVPGDDTRYATAQGSQQFNAVDEVLEVRGGPSEHLKIAMTRWGPVVGTDWEGRPYALQWTAQDPAALNFELMALERAKSAEEALSSAGNFGMPGQNMLVADRDGHIGWAIAGRLPVLNGARPDSPAAAGVAATGGATAPAVVAVPRQPQLSTDASVGSAGWLDPASQPHVIDPAEGLLWSANARVVGGAMAGIIGDGGLDRGARAAQIHQDLRDAPQPLTPLASLAIQLDDRAVFLDRWRKLMSEAVERSRSGGRHDQDGAHDVLARWSGHAQPDDPAYRLVQQFRSQVEARVYFMLIAPARQHARDFRFEIPSSFEGPLWRLMEAKPMHLLAARYADWDALLDAALVDAEKLPAACTQLISCTWGKVNTVTVAHPLSAAVPMLSAFLDMPSVTIPGGRADMPRIQGPDYGASERFSVSPGHEQEGYFHMPGAQSGHPLSPFYRAGFMAWADGKPTPFLPGTRAHLLTLTP